MASVALKIASRLAVGFLLPVSLPAQSIIVRDGWEAFPNVEYQAGDATQPKKRYGVLVLTDSSVALFECRLSDCGDSPPRPLWQKAPYFVIPLAKVTGVGSNSLVRGASTGDKLLLGALAGSHSEEFVAVRYETAASAEAPVFRVGKNMAGAIEAKIRFRLKKLGIVIPENVP